MEGGPGGSAGYNQRVDLVRTTVMSTHTRNSPTKLIVVDPMVVNVGRGSTQDTMIPSSATLDKVDVIVVLVNAFRVRV